MPLRPGQSPAAFGHRKQLFIKRFSIMIKRILSEGQLIAIIIRRSYESNGISFFTPEDFSQQLAYMKRPAGHKIAPHLHNEVQRSIFMTQEVLMIKSGRVKADFYDNDRKYIESTVLYPGDVILLASGGHGFEMLEESEIIEVKQGPYSGENDKTRFKPSEASPAFNKESEAK